MESPSIPMDVADINVCLLSAKKKSTSSPSLRDLERMSIGYVVCACGGTVLRYGDPHNGGKKKLAYP